MLPVTVANEGVPGSPTKKMFHNPGGDLQTAGGEWSPHISNQLGVTMGVVEIEGTSKLGPKPSFPGEISPLSVRGPISPYLIAGL